MLSIQSAGYNDPIAIRPADESRDLKLVGYEGRVRPGISDVFVQHELSDVRSYFSTGDTLYLYRMPADFNAQAWLMVSDADLGRTDRTATLEWPLIFTSVGGLAISHPMT